MKSQSNLLRVSGEPAGDEGSGVLVLPASLTINEAAEWRTVLLDRLGACATVVIDCAAVSVVDTIGLQLLCSARRMAVAQGRQFLLRCPSAVLSAACEAAGLAKSEVGFSGEEMVS